MASWAKITKKVIDKGFGGSRSGNTINGAVIHHAAGTDALAYVANANSRNSHPTYHVARNGDVTGIVHPDRRPYSTAGRPDPEAITFEIDNASAGGDWPVTDASLSSVAAVIADHYLQSPRKGKGIARNIVGQAQAQFFVAWHSQYVATACPGPFVLARIDAIIAAATTIANGGGTVPPVPQPPTTEARKAQVRKMGTFLNQQGLAAFRTAAADDGIAIDPGETYSRYYHLMQLWGAREGIYDTTKNSIDGIAGKNTFAVEAILWERIVASETPKPTEKPAVGTKFGATLPFKVYGTAAAAVAGGTAKGTYQAGAYWVYKIDPKTDAVNVTQTQGKAGGWTTWETLGWTTDVDEPEPQPTPKWTITFDANVGTPLGDVRIIEQGQAIGALPVVTREGYTFIAWADETGGYWTPDDVPLKNTLLTAVWEKVPDPEPEPEPDPDEIPGWFKQIVEKFIEFLKGLFGGNK